MTPKDKANYLFEKYYQIGKNHDYDFAKDCTLIAVDELFKELTKEISPSVHGFRHKYWLEVKQELEKL